MAHDLSDTELRLAIDHWRRITMLRFHLPPFAQSPQRDAGAIRRSILRLIMPMRRAFA
ncbi:MAG: hypothetical protein HY057_10990 [Rhodospirillales bacterium]|nr:hypothetical protein [Rhodospirillales bacterium]